jgi:hypothetical protein
VGKAIDLSPLEDAEVVVGMRIEKRLEEEARGGKQ